MLTDWPGGGKKNLRRVSTLLKGLQAGFSSAVGTAIAGFNAR
jgi:hypothetical protein